MNKPKYSENSFTFLEIYDIIDNDLYFITRSEEMKKSQVLAVAGATLLASGVLAACSNTSSNNAKLAKDYQYVYQTDPETLDYIVSNIDSTSFVTTNAVDGLLANDKYGNLVPSIAESWTVSKDGLT